MSQFENLGPEDLLGLTVVESDKSYDAAEELGRRINRLVNAAETVYTLADSNTLADLDCALNYMQTGKDDAR